MKWCRLSIIAINLVLLSGCQVLNFQTEPKVDQNCNYPELTGVEFRFNQLDPKQESGFNHIYVASSKLSTTLPRSYQGMVGKLTGKVINRYYAPLPRRSLFKTDYFYDRDNEYNDFYLTSAQREAKQRKENFIFQQAILQNCQIVYISIDSLAADSDNSKLIEEAELSILSGSL